MQVIRRDVRGQRGPDLSVLQLRVLAFLASHPGAALSAVGEHVGLTLPSISTQVTGLVARNLVRRSSSDADRRCLILTVTEDGRALLESAYQGAEADLSRSLTALSAQELAVLHDAMQLLQAIFAISPLSNTD